MKPLALVAGVHNLELDARSQRLALALAAQGFDVLFMGGSPNPRVDSTLLGMRFIRQRVLRIADVNELAGDDRRRLARLRDDARRGEEPVAGEQRHGVEPAWQPYLPWLAAAEVVYGPTIDQLRPDLIIGDVHMLPIMVGAAQRARLDDHRIALVYDARENVRGLALDDSEAVRGFRLLEEAHFRQMDAVITVSRPISDLLKDVYGFAEDLVVVENAPILGLPPVENPYTVRTLLGLAPEVPLLAYAGGLSSHRGVHTVVRSLAQTPRVHFAVGARGASEYLSELQAIADEVGVSDRFHLVPLAPPHEVADYLRSADAAVLPYLPSGNHLMAAPNRYFEAIQAGLPVITSDMDWLAGRVSRLGVGEVFANGDVDDCARAIGQVLADPGRYRERITDDLVRAHSWEAQESTLLDECRRVVGAAIWDRLEPATADEIGARHAEVRQTMLEMREPLANNDLFNRLPRLLIGPDTVGDQSRQWADALMRNHPGVLVQVRTRWEEGTPLTEQTITGGQASSKLFQEERLDEVSRRIRHVLAVDGETQFGTLLGPSYLDDRAHAGLPGITPVWATRPAAGGPDAGARLWTDRARAASDGGSSWLPYVAGHHRLPELDESGPPLVVFFTTDPDHPDARAVHTAAVELARAGVLRYKEVRGSGHTVPDEHLAGARVLLELGATGEPSLAGVDAMARGAAVVEVVRELGEPPHAPVTVAAAASVRQVLHDVATDAARRRAASEKGRAYADRWHSGRESARVLLGLMPA